jgi:hypothetical protein
MIISASRGRACPGPRTATPPAPTSRPGTAPAPPSCAASAAAWSVLRWRGSAGSAPAAPATAAVTTPSQPSRRSGSARAQKMPPMSTMPNRLPVSVAGVCTYSAQQVVDAAAGRAGAALGGGRAFRPARRAVTRWVRLRTPRDPPWPCVIWLTASTACVRELTPSARSTAATWSLTVSTDRLSWRAISLLGRPCSSSDSTSAWRGVRPTSSMRRHLLVRSACAAAPSGASPRAHHAGTVSPSGRRARTPGPASRRHVHRTRHHHAQRFVQFAV